MKIALDTVLHISKSWYNQLLHEFKNTTLAPVLKNEKELFDRAVRVLKLGKTTFQQKILLIKTVRENTGLPLKEAKEAVEKLLRENKK